MITYTYLLRKKGRYGKKEARRTKLLFWEKGQYDVLYLFFNVWSKGL